MNNNSSSCLWSQKPTALSFPNLFNGLSLVAVAFLTFELIDKTSFFFVPILKLTVAVLTIGITVKRAKSTTYAVFDNGVCIEQHQPYKMSVLAFNKIEKVTVNYGFLDRLFHFGTVTLHSTCASCSNLVLTGVKNPEAIRRIILATKENTR